MPVRREGKWRLEKVEEGRYEVLERKQKVAEIVTDEFVPDSGFAGISDAMTETIEVSDFGEAEEVFQEYADGTRGTGLF